MRLIEKFSESIKVLNDYRNLYHAESSSTEQYKVASAINDILPEFCRLIESDAEPVVHGHWIRCCDGAELQLVCNMCGYDYIEADPNCTEEHKFCPNCGAKMDEEQECET